VSIAVASRHEHASLHAATDPSDLFAQLQCGRFANCCLRQRNEATLQGLSRTPQQRQIEVVVRSIASAVDERRLRRQLGFLDERGNRQC
jgi:hypothetical protein